MWVGSNGYLTFLERDTDTSGGFSGHFEQPRVSMLWRDLDPRYVGDVTFNTTAQGVHVVTFERVPCFSGCGRSTFQAALHPDGTIELAWTDVDANNGGYGAYGPLVGISGGVEPATDEQTDFSEECVLCTDAPTYAPTPRPSYAPTVTAAPTYAPKTYEHAGDYVSYDECSDACARRGGQMPCVRSEEENEALLNAALAVGPARRRLNHEVGEGVWLAYRPAIRS